MKEAEQMTFGELSEYAKERLRWERARCVELVRGVVSCLVGGDSKSEWIEWMNGPK